MTGCFIRSWLENQQQVCTTSDAQKRLAPRCSARQPWKEANSHTAVHVWRRFMGTFGSTFSAYINRVRGYHSSCLVPDKGIYFTNWPQDEARSAVANKETVLTSTAHQASSNAVDLLVACYSSVAVRVWSCICYSCWLQPHVCSPGAFVNMGADFTDRLHSRIRWSTMPGGRPRRGGPSLGCPCMTRTCVTGSSH